MRERERLREIHKKQSAQTETEKKEPEFKVNEGRREGESEAEMRDYSMTSSIALPCLPLPSASLMSQGNKR